MNSKNHEQRIAQLERQVDALRQQIAGLAEGKSWWERIAGSFDKDPIYEKAMKLGREYRESLRPRTRSRPGQ